MKLLLFHLLIVVLFVSLAEAKTSGDYSYRTLVDQYCKLKKEIECMEAPSASSLKKLELSEISTVLACQDYYQANHCEEVKARSGRLNYGKIISCDPNKLCDDFVELEASQCILKGAKEQITFMNLGLLVAAGIGGNVATAASALSFPALLYSASQSAEQCHKDLNYKAITIKMHNLSLMEDERPLDITGHDKPLLNMQCSDLNAFLQNRLDVLSQNRAEKQRWSVKPLQYKQSEEAKAMRELLFSTKCLRPASVQEDLCRGLASLATGALIGGVQVVSGKVASLPGPKYVTKRKSFKYIGESSLSNIRYFNAAERAKYKISVSPEGKLLNANGRLLNVPKGIYVMDKEGNIFVFPELRAGEVHHSSLLAGEPVAGAGQLIVHNGVLKYIDRSSGHYKPLPVHFEQVINQLRELGVDISGAKSVNNFE